MMKREIKELIEKSIYQHKLSRQFYERMAALTSNDQTIDAFRYLADETHHSEAALEQCLTSDACACAAPVTDVHLADRLEIPAFRPDMPPKEAAAMAIEREDALHRLYETLAASQPPGELKDFLQHMADVELGHKAKMEEIYIGYAFPEAW